MVVEIKDINGNTIKVDSNEIYEGLAKINGLEEIYINKWQDDHGNWWLLTSKGFIRST